MVVHDKNAVYPCRSKYDFKKTNGRVCGLSDTKTNVNPNAVTNVFNAYICVTGQHARMKVKVVCVQAVTHIATHSSYVLIPHGPRTSAK